MRPLRIIAPGMMTSVGLDALSTAAAVRGGISGSVETQFVDQGGEWLLGCPVPLENFPTGLGRLKALLLPPLAECLRASLKAKAPEIPMLLIVAEPSRAGRLDGLEEELPESIESELKIKFHERSAIFPEGRVGLISALRTAEKLLHEEKAPACIVAGVDSMLVGRTLAALEAKDRLLTSVNSNGFIPGEAGAAVLIGIPAKGDPPGLICTGLGEGKEPSPIDSEEPLRADGMVQAMRQALQDASTTFDNVDYRLTDVSGEQYGFKEAVLAIGRAMRKVKPDFPIWHPADSLGEVGAATGPCLLGVALEAGRRGYAPGPGVLCHLSADDGRRGSLVLRFGAGSA